MFINMVRMRYVGGVHVGGLHFYGGQKRYIYELYVSNNLVSVSSISGTLGWTLGTPGRRYNVSNGVFGAPPNTISHGH